MVAIDLFLVAFAAAFGAAIGSFLNVCIYRLPRPGLSVHRPARSFCPACGTGIHWFDNLPLASWLILGGRCRACRAPISVRYLLVEAITTLLYAVIAVRYLTGGERLWSTFVVVAALATALIVASFIDIDLRILPDAITLPGVALAPLVALLVPDLHTRPVDGSISWLLGVLAPRVEFAAAAAPEALRRGPGLILCVGGAAILLGAAGVLGRVFYQRLRGRVEASPLRDGLLSGILAAIAGGALVFSLLRPELLLHPRLYSLWAALAGMLCGSGLVLIVGWLGTIVFRKPAMGFGDVKLMGFLGAFTGWAGVLAGFFLACFLGSVVGVFLLLRYRSRYLPFGPFLALGSLAMILWPEAVSAGLAWYLSLFA
jgi:leader peptidase (prepilin peptidase)/N-methyltransferase